MPNWCINKLTVVDGPEEEKLRFLKAIRRLDFNDFIPESPEDQINRDDDWPPELPSWYCWRIKNWGTKWNPEEIQDMGDGVKFETPFSPPFPVFMAISNCFPKLKLQLLFVEPLNWIAGRVIAHNGQVLEDYSPKEDAAIEALVLQVFD